MTEAQKTERKKAAFRKWYYSHREEAVKSLEQRRRKNGVKKKVIYTEAQRREVQRLNLQRWRKNNPEKDRAISSAWRTKNRSRFLSLKSRNQRVRDIKKKNQTHPESCHKTEKLIFLECRRLTKESGIHHNVDHIIPVCHGGFHHHLNLQIIPWFINQSKGSNPFWVQDGFKTWKDVPCYLWPEKLKPEYEKKIAA
jgi:hypothetical protein